MSMIGAFLSEPYCNDRDLPTLSYSSSSEMRHVSAVPELLKKIHEHDRISTHVYGVFSWISRLSSASFDFDTLIRFSFGPVRVIYSGIRGELEGCNADMITEL